jgi:hypothetical protein
MEFISKRFLYVCILCSKLLDIHDVFAVLRGLCVCAAVPFKQRNCMFTFLNRKICVFTILNRNLNIHCNAREH